MKIIANTETLKIATAFAYGYVLVMLDHKPSPYLIRQANGLLRDLKAWKMLNSDNKNCNETYFTHQAAGAFRAAEKIEELAAGDKSNHES